LKPVLSVIYYHYSLSDPKEETCSAGPQFITPSLVEI
jgi:hypothetical protein